MSGHERRVDVVDNDRQEVLVYGLMLIFQIGVGIDLGIWYN